MNLSTTKIKSLNPCQSRLDNFIQSYGDNWKGSLKQFLNLKKITRQDKGWVFFRVVKPSVAVSVAADIAESVLHIYEKQYPGDMRPREAIEAARRGDVDLIAYAAAANAAAANAANAAAAYAARAAADAAVHAVYAAVHAVYAAGGGRVKQEKVNLKIMKRYAK